VRVGVLLVVSTAFGDDGFDFGNAVLNCLFVGRADTLAFDVALGHALPHELCEDIAGKDRWSFGRSKKTVVACRSRSLGSLRLVVALAGARLVCQKSSMISWVD
jgi:hypothetical protein